MFVCLELMLISSLERFYWAPNRTVNVLSGAGQAQFEDSLHGGALMIRLKNGQEGLAYTQHPCTTNIVKSQANSAIRTFFESNRTDRRQQNGTRKMGRGLKWTLSYGPPPLSGKRTRCCGLPEVGESAGNLPDSIIAHQTILPKICNGHLKQFGF